MSKAVSLPLCPFGNVKWWSSFLLSDSVVLDGVENYQKQTWRNRYDILGANGKQGLTIPVSKPSGDKVRTKDIKLFHDQHWKKVHWRSIKSAYGSSPYWIYYSEQLGALFTKEYMTLSSFSLASIRFIKEELQLEKQFHIESEKKEDRKELLKEFKPSKCHYINEPYLQVFDDRFSFHENLSIIDVLFNLGPETESYLLRQSSD